ncbi:MAG: hypothetical protein OXC94_05710 [Chloroflexi bacterium]|nr:hypothetical protein [Chloroflexota bacterium]
MDGTALGGANLSGQRRGDVTSDFCPAGCYWPDCEHRADGDARPAPPAGTRWVVRGGVEVAEPRPATDTLVDAVDEYFGEVLLITGRPWSPR